MEAGSRRSIGLRPIANSMGVLPLEVTGVFLTVAALRNNWAGVICARVVLSKFLEAVSTSAKRNFLNRRTPISARFGHGVCGPAVLVQLAAVWEEPKVRALHHQYLGHAFLQQVPSLMLAGQVV